jgi:hypothetical protein
LYTGDFRLENVKLPTLTNLHSLAGEPLKIDVMYLDTTFCSKEYENFPLRDHAYEAIWELVNSWIRKNGMYVQGQATGAYPWYVVACKAIEKLKSFKKYLGRL